MDMSVLKIRKLSKIIRVLIFLLIVFTAVLFSISVIYQIFNLAEEYSG